MRAIFNMDWLSRRIAAKTVVLFAALLTLFAALTLAVNVWGERVAEAGRASDVARLYAMRAADAAMRGGRLDDPQALAAIDEAARQNSILRARIVDRSGAPVAQHGLMIEDWTRADTWLIRSAIGSGDGAQSGRGGAAHVAIPVVISGRVAGVVLTSASMEGVGAATAAVFRRSMLGSALAFLLLMPIAAWCFARAARPLHQIIDFAREAARGRLDSRLVLKSGDELEELADGFNAMLERLKGSLEHVRQLAYADHLTGLPNKTAFLEQSRALLNGGPETGAVFLIDLDRFKRLNDTFGAKQGDRLIKTAAQRIQAAANRYVKSVAGEDGCADMVLSRIAADEFALIMAGCGEGWSAEGLAGGIVQAIGEPVDVLGQHVVITGSVGIAHMPHHGQDPETLMRNANLALDEVKKTGGASQRTFDAHLTDAALQRVTLEHDLRRGLERDEFIVHYQPKIAARGGAVTGAEALVRWRLPDGSIRTPGGFIKVAEETGLIAEMGDRVLREACRAAARWRARGLQAPIAVNVSALQFERRDFHRRVVEALESADLPPDQLELELTESTAMTDPERASAQIEPLRAMGVRFAIDDFGTGHSSLAHLTRMPFDTFKIDQSFVRALGEDPNARTIIQTIMALARSLGLKTVAEGAEEAEQVAVLQAMGCNQIQGFYFARPMPEADFVEYALRAPKGGETDREESDGVVTPFNAAL